MKVSIVLLALVQQLTSVSACTGFMPPSYHEDNMNNPDLSDEIREAAAFTLNMTRYFSTQRQSMGSQGFTTTPDDENYPQEESPDYQATLQAEDTYFSEHDNDVPNPDYVEGAKRRRARRSALKQARALFAPNRFIYDINRSSDRRFLGQLVRTETSGFALDSAVNDVFDGFFWTFFLYSAYYNRNSIDGRGEALHGVVHYCNNLDNAFWTGRTMLFGDGNGQTSYFGSFAMSQDVIGHEVTHGVVQRSNPLHYYGQTGALNEHLADVFGIMSRQLRENTNALNDTWLLGAGIDTQGRATRSFADPTNGYVVASQPTYYQNRYTGTNDDGGVHINSGIPNHAFYLFSRASYVASGGTVYGGAPGHIWYNVLSGAQGAFGEYSETFPDFAEKTLRAAQALYGQTVAQRLYTAWRQVGVL